MGKVSFARKTHKQHAKYNGGDKDICGNTCEYLLIYTGKKKNKQANIHSMSNIYSFNVSNV